MLKQGCLLLLELLNDCKLLEELPRPVTEEVPRPVAEAGEMIGPDHSSCSGRGWSKLLLELVLELFSQIKILLLELSKLCSRVGNLRGGLPLLLYWLLLLLLLAAATSTPLSQQRDVRCTMNRLLTCGFLG